MSGHLQSLDFRKASMRDGYWPMGALWIIVVAAWVVTACAPLTKSQVKEVQEFAKAAQGYGVLPGEAIGGYQEVFQTRRTLSVAGQPVSDEDRAERRWKKILESFTLERAFEREARQADEALQILDTYSELLLLLSSDNFTEELEKSARSLGTSLDKAIGEYNKRFGAELNSIGAAVAAAVRGIGGLFIRYRQAVLLKAYVRAADPMVEQITKDVEDVAALLAEPALREGVQSIIELEPCDPVYRLCLELSEFKTSFARLSLTGGRVALGTAVQVSQSIAKIDATHKLARSAVEAAKKYRAAHRELKENLRERKTLKARIEVIQALAEEIRAARALHKALGK